MSRRKEDNIYRPGELAPVSGIYRVIHLTRHRQPHSSVIIRGEELPQCRLCKGDVHFEVMHMASHVTHDWDFTAPTGLTVRQLSTEFANLRSFPRRQVALPVRVELSGGRTPLQGHTADVSDGGVCAILDSKLAANDALVSLCIQIPGATSALNARALMRYRAGNRHGFLFTETDENAQAMVREFVIGARRLQS